MVGALVKSDNASEIPSLSGDNYKIWKEKVLLHLGCIDLDYALRKEEPPMLTNTNTKAETTLYERWERSNRLSMMFIKSPNVKDYMHAIDEQFESSDKSLASTLMR
ncbi:PREDICTED: uncharacterized protein LOC105956967 [Erythranthe guttata]|uniref:uncharacterized protein LOC105956967 n=1 Tax=Erythranthe guttata TaxID=4155 RepID=UPI00064DB98D|nr:PREDICTED: uncharacterized protein LOC105956967 [Erythranthe guttata]|eukprot:XP_012836331.1 PREDICTED: uncharacterized protein LOC105956967 [Erythranthe guttata]